MLIRVKLVYVRISDDKQALIWDLTAKSKTVMEPLLAFGAEGEINSLQVRNISGYLCKIYSL